MNNDHHILVRSFFNESKSVQVRQMAITLTFLVANCRTISRPIPRPAPVTKAVCPGNSNVIFECD
ncbi:hypothetical protein DERP_005232 [Dermatophagoides pteronyssinus]|uniref:Lipoprotein n=1 Tax=Dermatophagoides pteronyssinus TaxID=6956 RepID=A0ABQ8JM09_DERPT|nr:hypothetical protein DERP_005232 [Dermatophagoides pteronyssinus]